MPALGLAMLVIGLALFVPGAILAHMELKKNKEDRDNTRLYIGIALGAVSAVLWILGSASRG
jgi:hypothetical protein